VHLTQEGLTLSGWAAVPHLRVAWDGGARDVAPDRPRADVAARRGGNGLTGFEVALPAEARPLTLEIPLPSGRVLRRALPHPSDPPGPAARRRMIRAFLRDLGRAVPSLVRFALAPDPARKSAVKRALGLDGALPVPTLDPRWLEECGASIPDPGPFTIVMPVHDAFDILTEALGRLARHTPGDWHLVLVDDASTDPRVRPWLAAWAAARPGRVRFVPLRQNLGFVGAVNRGLEIAEARQGPVVLLNTDALVPDGWAGRLLAPLADPGVASVTPMSNDAEIFGAPLPGRPVRLAPGVADRVDTVARAIGGRADLPSAPTGVGFCMAMSRRWLARVPRLDPAFGRGYGEEVDWCRKVQRLGGRHVCQPSLFVEHRGAHSFGASKAARLRASGALISRRYPRYDAEVQAYFAADPLRTPRLALAIAAAGFAARGPVPVYLAHALGGGAAAALDAEIAYDLDRTGAALVLRVGGRSRFRVELHLPEGRLAGDTADPALLRAMLAPVPRLRVVYSCGVGDADPVTLPDLLLSLRRQGGRDLLEARLHDHFPLSPSYCLLSSDGRYRGPVPADYDDPAHVALRPDGRAVALDEWRSAWGRFLSECDEIRAYSRAGAALFSAAYPGCAGRLTVRPHPHGKRPATVRPPAEGPGALGVLGNLNAQKGAAVVAGLAARLRRAGDPRRVVVIGNVDATCPLPASVRIHGGYRREEISALAARYGISVWIVPSVWPETFSFVTHEALGTGLPVLAFDIGGQGDAVAAAANGRPVAYDPDADLAARLHAALPPATAQTQRAPRALPNGAIPQ
jgi:GT2 family glycosyltransferase/glycosyltransferase involved in cell wall biosynthesis